MHLPHRSTVRLTAVPFARAADDRNAHQVALTALTSTHLDPAAILLFAHAFPFDSHKIAFHFAFRSPAPPPLSISSVVDNHGDGS
jgi:hypothetical protein